MAFLCAYAVYRMTRRASTPVDEVASYQAIAPNASPMAATLAQEAAIEAVEDAAAAETLRSIPA
jgi:hypothetical protein